MSCGILDIIHSLLLDSLVKPGGTVGPLTTTLVLISAHPRDITVAKVKLYHPALIDHISSTVNICLLHAQYFRYTLCLSLTIDS